MTTEIDIPDLWKHLNSNDRRVVSSALEEAQRLSERELNLLYRWACIDHIALTEAQTTKNYQDTIWSILLSFIPTIGMLLLPFEWFVSIVLVGIVIYLLAFGNVKNVKQDTVSQPRWHYLVTLLPEQIKEPDTIGTIISLCTRLPRFTMMYGVTKEPLSSQLLPKASLSTLVERLQNALKRSLPLLTPKVANRISKEERETLYTLLDSPYSDVELTLAILNAIPLLMDANALPHVQKLMTEGKGSQRMQRVSDAARKCQLALLRNLAEKQESTLLLRPSSNASEQATTLLRPAKDSPEDSQDLLRPTSSER